MCSALSGPTDWILCYIKTTFTFFTFLNNNIRWLMRRRKREIANSKRTGKEADWNRYKEIDKDLKKQLTQAHAG